MNQKVPININWNAYVYCLNTAVYCRLAKYHSIDFTGCFVEPFRRYLLLFVPIKCARSHSCQRIECCPLKRKKLYIYRTVFICSINKSIIEHTDRDGQGDGEQQSNNKNQTKSFLICCDSCTRSSSYNLNLFSNYSLSLLSFFWSSPFYFFYFTLFHYDFSRGRTITE